ncbi:lipase family protein [Aliikangiella maris]|uniref:Fungal lipase-like domain-containing protein n=2 Tax=Aliikangiella maris TaxID=3162458 RepID=A0ABV2BZZ7_9GAMM
MARKAGKSRSVTFTGHSLGGGLASAASLSYLRNAVTFNAAGLHSNVVDRYRERWSGKPEDFIKAYYLKGDILSHIQDSPLIFWQAKLLGKIPAAAGKRIPLSPGPGTNTHSQINLHRMTEVLKSEDL